MEEPEGLPGLARNGLREIAAGELKARGQRKDGGLLSGWGLRLFRGKSLEEVQEIAFEIGMLGQHAQDVDDPKETHALRAACRGVSSRRWISRWIWAKGGGWRRGW